MENLKYYITDTKSAAKDKTYYEGYTPNGNSSNGSVVP